MQKFETQVGRPETLPVVDATLQIDAETTEEQQIAQCQEIVQAKLETIIYNALKDIGSRIENLELVDQETYIHEIIAFKAALDKFYQELQFLTYDVEYGLNDKEDKIAIPIEFKGDSMDRLSILEAVTLIMRLADSSLTKVNGIIKGFEEVIQEAKGRLADAELDGSEKDQTKYATTIKSREEKGAKQMARKNDLVHEINAVLRVDPKDTEALMKNAEKLLLFLIRNKWIKNYISMDQAKAPAEMLKSFNIEKNIEEEEVKAPVMAVDMKQQSRGWKKFIPIGGAAAFGALMVMVFSEENHSLQPKGYPQKQGIYEYYYNFKRGKIKLLSFSKDLKLSDKDKLMISAENNIRAVERVMQGAGIDPNDGILEGKSPILSNNKTWQDPVASKTYVLDFKEEILSKKAYRSKKHPNNKGHVNTYMFLVRRTMIVSTVYEGGVIKPVNRPLTTEGTFSRKLNESKSANTGKRKILTFDRKRGGPKFQIGKDNDGKTTITIKRKDGKPLFR